MYLSHFVYRWTRELNAAVNPCIQIPVLILVFCGVMEARVSYSAILVMSLQVFILVMLTEGVFVDAL